MRFLLVVGAYPPSDKHGGPAVSNHQLARALIAAGHRAFVLTTDINGSERLDVPHGDTEWEGVPVRYCRWVRCPLPYHSPELARELRRRAASFDIALISSSWTMYGVGAGRNCRRTALPYVMYGHGSYGPVHLRRRRWMKRLFWTIFDRRLYDGAAAVVALTEFEKRCMRAMGFRRPVHVIPNGVCANELKAAGSRETIEGKWPALRGRPFILFLGRIERIKGVDLLLRAFARVHRDHPAAVLVVVGPSERYYGEEMKRLADRLRLSESVVFTGTVGGPEKWALLRYANLLALTSYGEGLPMAVLEAMAAGTAVVVTEECNLPEVRNREAGFVVNADVDSVASGVDKALRDPELCRAMGENGMRLVKERFSWPRVAEATAALCRSVVGGDNGMDAPELSRFSPGNRENEKRGQAFHFRVNGVGVHGLDR